VIKSMTGALVTGAGGRIGREIALALASEGRAMIVHYNLSQAEAEQTVAMINEAGGSAAMLQADLGDPVAAAGVVPRAAALLETFGSTFGCLVNNASHFVYDSAADFSQRLFDQHMAVNVRAPALLSRAFAKHIGDRADTDTTAVIVNIVDQKVQNPDPDYLSYTLSKFALDGLTKTLALALAPTIRVVGVAPGLTLPSRELSGDAFDQAAASLPFGRATSASDIAATVCYVASAPSITGQTITVDSGQHLMDNQRDIAFEVGDHNDATG